MAALSYSSSLQRRERTVVFSAWLFIGERGWLFPFTMTLSAGGRWGMTAYIAGEVAVLGFAAEEAGEIGLVETDGLEAGDAVAVAVHDEEDDSQRIKGEPQ